MAPTTHTIPKRLFPGLVSNVIQRLGSNNFFEFECADEARCLIHSGFAEFEDFWHLPREFVDQVNYRRGGWSGVSKLALGNGSEEKHYFVKRQENQFRYAIRKPFGALTYNYEIDAIRRNKSLGFPSMDIACYGMRKAGSIHQGIIVSRAIEHPSLSEINAGGSHGNSVHWKDLEPILRHAGLLLFKMHRQRIQHGALYPDHCFINLSSGQLQLIDFERSRIRHTVHGAIASDLKQFIKRVVWMPDIALDAFLAPYMPRYESLIHTLRKKYQNP